MGFWKNLIGRNGADASKEEAYRTIGTFPCNDKHTLLLQTSDSPRGNAFVRYYQVALQAASGQSVLQSTLKRMLGLGQENVQKDGSLVLHNFFVDVPGQSIPDIASAHLERVAQVLEHQEAGFPVDDITTAIQSDMKQAKASGRHYIRLIMPHGQSR